MRYQTMTRTVGRLAAVALAATALALGISSGANADGEVGAPQLQSLRLEAPDAYITFKDNSAIETHFSVTLRERDNPDRVVISADVLPAPGEGRVVTRSVRGIAPGVPLCATVRAMVWGENIFNPRDNPPARPIEAESAPSNSICIDPNVRPPDLALEKIGGQEERDWVVVARQAPAYLVIFRNDGADATGTVTVDIATSGVATLGEQIAVVRQGWEAAGFACSTRQPAGAETAALRCTGGSLKQGERINPAVIVRFTGQGYGYIHAAVSVNGDPVEADTSDNLTVLGIRIY